MQNTATTWVQSPFQPPRWLQNPHLQTLLPRLLLPSRPVPGEWTLFPTADGDQVELFWHRPHPESQPLIVIFHGLEGSVDSPYVWQLMEAAAAQGWNSVVMHFRGCGRFPNKLPRAYHSGDTADARHLLQHLAQSYPTLATVGFSLGGNMLSKLLGEGNVPGVRAAASIAAPIDLAACAGRLDQGFSKLYRHYLLGSLRRKFKQKQAQRCFAAGHSLAALNIDDLRTFYQFDDAVTAPLHGFAGVDDYYRRASARPHLAKVEVPLLQLHAQDDPFMTAGVIPEAHELSPYVTYEISEFGGHMGFITYRNRRFEYYLPARIVQFLAAHLTH